MLLRIFPTVKRHQPLIILFLIIILWHFAKTQFTATTYPDPRTDHLACKIVLPGQLCDPSEILLPEERRNLIEKIFRVISFIWI